MIILPLHYRYFANAAISCFAPLLLITTTFAADPKPDHFAGLGAEYATKTLPAMKQFCLNCHSTKKQEGELDLERFAKLDDARRDTKVWLKVAEMLDNGEMPPKDAKQPTADERKQLRSWVERFLHAAAAASAGDPGPVVLRRLNNAEYTYTIRDLTQVPLEPAKEFPADSAAGEGFTNTGNSLVMSPALLTKYLNAGKEIASHAVLLPDGFHFSPSSNRSDWTNDALARIRAIYREHSDAGGASQVNLQGVVFNTNDGGRLNIEKYLAATIAEREAIQAKQKSIEQVAKEHSLNAKYLGILWTALTDRESSALLDPIRKRWQTAKPEEAKSLAQEITEWQQSLWRFTSVGHIGKLNGPKAWQEPVMPMVAKQDVRLKLTAAPEQKEVTLYLQATDAGDGNANDFVVWQQPRLVAPGRPDLLLRDVRTFAQAIAARREKLFASTSQALAAAEEVSQAKEAVDLAAIAAKHKLELEVLSTWLDYLGIGPTAAIKLDLFKDKIEKSGNYDFVKGWGVAQTPNLSTNASDMHVRVPGNMKPHCVCVHPSPTLAAAVGWKSPLAGKVRIEGKVTHAHPECGNGVTWSLELRRGVTRQRLASGTAQGNNVVTIPPVESLAVQAGDLISLLIGPRDANHSCDLTNIELTLKDLDKPTQEWSLARDVADDVLAGNPHADKLGNVNVWHFYTEPLTGQSNGLVVPAGSLLARWQTAEKPEDKRQLADALQQVLTTSLPSTVDEKLPDTQLYRQLTSLSGPFLMRAAKGTNASPTPINNATNVGLDPAWFGKHPNGATVDAASLCVQAPSLIEIHLPVDLAQGAEFVTSGSLHAETAKEGSVQLQVSLTKPSRDKGLLPASATESQGNVNWTAGTKPVLVATPIVVNEGSNAKKKFEVAFENFRSLFPIALCYTKIVPVDEVVTLTLFYREDEHLQKLMLNESQIQQLNQLWDELHFVSRDAFTLVDAFQQLLEYASQDGDPKVFEPLRKPINDRAAAYQQALLDAEPKHIAALLQFAGQAYRRPLTKAEEQELLALYRKLRTQELPHEEAFLFTLARVFISPAFLYRLEQAPAGSKAAAVSDWELASRLSYFLWSSQPDVELRQLAATGKLRDPEVLAAQTKRMLADPRSRRLATEFACQWLHIYDFNTLDEKSEKHFPEFAELRNDMYEEAILFFTDMFQRDASVLDVLNANHTFVNDRLAKFYDIANINGSEWRRVEGLQQAGRGGILGLSATLAKQSGASRTSPILRGNWVSEVLLGEKLPKPPKDVPRLPEDETATEGLTVRQLIEKHTSDSRCSSCHMRIDPYGFSLEAFDAIGRKRDKDLAGRTIDAKTKLPSGEEINGLPGLRSYLSETKRDVVLRQFHRKLLGYALGRATQLSDEPLLTEIQTQLAKHEYRISVAFETIVRSPQFREIRGREASAEFGMRSSE